MTSKSDDMMAKLNLMGVDDTSSFFAGIEGSFVRFVLQHLLVAVLSLRYFCSPLGAILRPSHRLALNCHQHVGTPLAFPVRRLLVAGFCFKFSHHPIK